MYFTFETGLTPHLVYKIKNTNESEWYYLDTKHQFISRHSRAVKNRVHQTVYSHRRKNIEVNLNEYESVSVLLGLFLKEVSLPLYPIKMWPRSTKRVWGSRLETKIGGGEEEDDESEKERRGPSNRWGWTSQRNPKNNERKDQEGDRWLQEKSAWGGRRKSKAKSGGEWWRYVNGAKLFSIFVLYLLMFKLARSEFVLFKFYLKTDHLQIVMIFQYIDLLIIHLLDISSFIDGFTLAFHNYHLNWWIRAILLSNKQKTFKLF